MFQRRSVRWASAAVAAIVVLGGISIFSRPSKPGTGKGPWWEGPSSAWASEINAALAKASIKGVTCRERTLWVRADGSSHLSSTWNKFYVSNDSYRRDIYDGDRLREVQWYIPKNGGMLQTGYRLDKKTYGAIQHQGSFGQQDPVERVRFYVGLIDKADRLLGRQSVDGHESVGFEIHANKYGSNPDTYVDRIWFDVGTKLPVRIELVGRPVTGDAASTFTTVQEQFDFSPNLPSDTFMPSIPKGFTFSNSPDPLPDKW